MGKVQQKRIESEIRIRSSPRKNLDTDDGVSKEQGIWAGRMPLLRNEIQLLSPSQGMKSRPPEKQNPEFEGYDSISGWSPGEQHSGRPNRENRDVPTDTEQ